MKYLKLIVLLLPLSAYAADAEYLLVIKDHQFQPAEITVPVGKKIKLVVDNQDATPEEFESYALGREKIVAGHSKTTIYIGPLNAGKYSFMGEFNAATAKGVIVAQ